MVAIPMLTAIFVKFLYPTISTNSIVHIVSTTLPSTSPSDTNNRS